MALWSFTEEDILGGLRERGLPLESLDDLTAKERSLLHQYADLALNEATRALIDALAAQIEEKRGWNE
ncbi:MAG: hypothetical protein IIA91_07990 [Chloroflexi bacterium]|nr:hypothetical protein [Chloroflexota bacterium]MCH8345814.1 hypothetical protein [Chloroflexota bacterium]